jgi:hypothetical protein
MRKGRDVPPPRGRMSTRERVDSVRKVEVRQVALPTLSRHDQTVQIKLKLVGAVLDTDSSLTNERTRVMNAPQVDQLE